MSVVHMYSRAYNLDTQTLMHCVCSCLFKNSKAEHVLHGVRPTQRPHAGGPAGLGETAVATRKPKVQYRYSSTVSRHMATLAAARHVSQRSSPMHT